MEIENRTQWHPAFCTSMELELIENKKGLTYDREYNLNSEPLRIDLLIIKKDPNEVIRNEIGAFFLGYNIVEYKSPDDRINIDTFYKVLSYACLYKSDTGAVDEILDTDITITLMREKKPKKLLGQLAEKYQIIKKGEGIYQISGMLFPMQIIVIKELERNQHVWLRSLTRSMDLVQAEELLNNYEGLQNDEDREKAGVIVNLVSDINSALFEQIVSGGEKMSEALKKMILPELGELKLVLADKEAEIADKEAEIADKEAEIADKEAEIADKEAKIADKEAEIADKEAEIAELKRMLAEARGEQI